MKASARVRFGLKDFKLLFRPRTIIFFKKNTKTIKIYLQKEVQVIGIVKELIPPMAPNINYSFSQFNSPNQFRIATDKITTYTLSLYEVTNGGTEYFIEKVQLKISKFLEQFLKEFQALDDKLNNQLKDKEAPSLTSIWKTLLPQFTHKIFTSGVRFETIQGILEYTLEPVHQYDIALRQEEEKDQKRREKREKHEQIYRRTRSIPQKFPPQDNNQKLKRGKTESQLTLAKPFPFLADKKQQKKEEDVAHYRVIINTLPQGVLSNIAEVEEPDPSNFRSSFSLPRTTKTGFNEAGNSSIPQVSNQGGELIEQKPNILVDKEKYLRSQEIKNETNLKSLQIQSIIHVNDSQNQGIKEKLSNLAMLSLSFVTVYFLMHPLSRA